MVAPLSCLAGWEKELKKTFAALLMADTNNRIGGLQQSSSNGGGDGGGGGFRGATGCGGGTGVKVEVFSSGMAADKRLAVLQAAAKRAQKANDKLRLLQQEKNKQKGRRQQQPCWLQRLQTSAAAAVLDGCTVVLCT